MATITHTPRLLDTDTTLAKLPPDRAVALLNLTPEEDYTGLTSGTALVLSLSDVDGRNVTVGTVEDPKGQSLVHFVWNENGLHRLLRTYVLTGQQVELLRAPQIDLRETDEITQTGVIGDYVAWLDRDGVQYRLNMAAAAAGAYATETDSRFYRLARPAPLYAPLTNRYIPVPALSLNRLANNDWQLAYRYGYSENDVTVLSRYSIVNRAVKGNALGSAMQVWLPLEEVPGPQVERIEFYARKNEQTVWRLAKTIKRDSNGNWPTAPSVGTLTPGFSFTGQTFGEALSDDEASKLFESIPITSRALGVADNRILLGDNKEGYALPPALNLTATLEQVPDQAFEVAKRRLFQLKFETQNGDDASRSREFYAYFLLMQGVQGTDTARYVPAAWNHYLKMHFEVRDTPLLTYDQVQIEAGRQAAAQDGNSIISKVTAFIDLGLTDYVLFKLVPSMKSRSAYQMGLVFYDEAGRNNGTLTNDNCLVQVPDLNLATLPVGQRIRWQLDPASASVEIPEWAVSYGFVLTPAQGYLAFQEFHVAEVLHLAKGADPSSPTFVDATTAGSSSDTLWIDISPLASVGGGYEWQADSGDYIRLWLAPDSNVATDYKIQGQQGEYLFVNEPGAVSYARVTRAEIFSPRESAPDSYYEVGPAYAVVKTVQPDGTVERSYSILSDALPTDVYLTTQLSTGIVAFELQEDIEFPTVDGKYYSRRENPSTPAEVYNRYYDKTKDLPRNKHYGFYNGMVKQLGDGQTQPRATGGLPGFFEVLTDVTANNQHWLNDRGRPSTVLADGPPLPALRETDVRWGGQLLPGSRINGLAAFNDESVVTLGHERGRVVALVLAVQQQESGTVLIAVQAYGYSSLYLGEAVVRQTNGNSLAVDTTKVVGTVRGGAGDKGSIHAGSVTPANGRLFMWSQYAATILRYDQSGITDLCETFRCQVLGRQLAALNAYRVVGGYDPEAQAYYLTFYYFDGDAPKVRTVAFSERGKGFSGDYSFASYTYAALGEYMYSFDAGNLYRHDTLAPKNTFYGTLYPGSAVIVPNGGAKESKEWLSLAYHGTDAWDTPLLENEQEGGRVQRSRTYASWAAFSLGAWTVALRKNMLKPVYDRQAVLITDPDRLLQMGEPMQSSWLRVKLEILSDKPVRLDAVDINFNFLTGQQAKPTR